MAAKEQADLDRAELRARIEDFSTAVNALADYLEGMRQPLGAATQAFIELGDAVGKRGCDIPGGFSERLYALGAQIDVVSHAMRASVAQVKALLSVIARPKSAHGGSVARH